jgi:hypothetical protein
MPASQSQPRHWRPLTSLLAAASLLAGCAGYSVGPTGGQVAGARSIEIRPFADQTREPRLIEPVATALRKEIQRDGTLRLATSEPGDILVTGTLVEYVRNPLTLQPNDVFSTRDYDIRLTAHVIAIDRSTGRTVLDRNISGRVPVRAAADLGSAERMAAPLVAEQLAHNITTLLVDGNW